MYCVKGLYTGKCYYMELNQQLRLYDSEFFLQACRGSVVKNSF